jgi:hypothetical protein
MVALVIRLITADRHLPMSGLAGSERDWRRLGELMTKASLVQLLGTWQGQIYAVGPDTVDAKGVLGSVGLCKSQFFQHADGCMVLRVSLGG